MTNKEIKNINEQDWRLQAVTTLAKEFKSPGSSLVHPVGSIVTLIGRILYSDKIISFGLPNMTALFLDFAYNAFEAAIEEFNQQILDINSKTNLLKNNEEIFHALEMMMASIIFSFTALECFANENIPEDYIYECENDDKKYTKKYHKKQIENSLSLDVKLGDILPTIMSINSPKGNKMWNNFQNLKKLRDRIIHLKSEDRKSTDPQIDTIWRELFASFGKKILLLIHLIL